MSMHSKFASPAVQVLLLGLVFVPWALGNQFLDDYGDVHVLYEQPRVIASATTAVSLLHIGMPKDWLVATWGSLYNRASNLISGEESEYFSMDAQPEDLQFLRSLPSFSHPACLDPSQGGDADCWGGFQYDVVKSLRGGSANMIIDLAWAHGSEISTNTSSILEIPVIGISTEFDNAIGCTEDDSDVNYHKARNSNCYRRSYIDVVNRVHDVAEWMGIDTSDDEGRTNLCKASNKLHNAASYAQSEGIRFAAGSIQDSSEYLPGTSISMFLTNPLQFSTVRTLEELGMPMLWPGLCDDPSCQAFGEIPQAYETVSPDLYFKDCPAGQPNADCGSTPLYAIDFWLLEGYGFQQMEDDPEGFKAAWPDKALLEGQYMAFSFDAHVWSYNAIAGYFDALADKIMSSKRLHPKTSCVEAHVTSTAHIDYGEASLNGGEYACFNPAYHNQDYLTCPKSLSSTISSDGLSVGAVTGIAIGCVLGGFAIAFVFMKYFLGYRSGIDHNYTENASEKESVSRAPESESEEVHAL